LEPQATADQRILSLAGKIRYAVDPNSHFPARITGELLITQTDGRIVRHREEISLNGQEETTEANVVEKFQSNAMTAVSRRQAQEIQECLLHLEAFADAKSIAGVFQGDTFTERKHSV